MSININMSLLDLAKCIVSENSKDELFELIKCIELRIGEADFTEKLAKWALNEAVKEFRLDNGNSYDRSLVYVISLLDKALLPPYTQPILKSSEPT